MSNLPYPKAIIFDWDNTLVDSWSVIKDALNTTFLSFGMREWDMDEIRHKVQESLRDSFPKYFGADWEKAGKIFYRRYAEIHADRISPLPGAGEMLHSFFQAGIYLAVVSNKKGTFLRKESKKLDWDKYFVKLVGAFDAEKDKPNQEPVNLALKPGNIYQGAHVWFVGDTEIDMQCAHITNCTPILLHSKFPKPEKSKKFPPALRFQHCRALCNYVLNM